jgi:hypothetical protein
MLRREIADIVRHFWIGQHVYVHFDHADSLTDICALEENNLEIIVACRKAVAFTSCRPTGKGSANPKEERGSFPMVGRSESRSVMGQQTCCRNRVCTMNFLSDRTLFSRCQNVNEHMLAMA